MGQSNIRWVGSLGQFVELIRELEIPTIKRPAGASHLPDRPNRNGSHEDRVMAVKSLPSAEVLCQLLRYEPETGKLFWKERSPEWFRPTRTRSREHNCAIWNSRYAGMEALSSSDGTGRKLGPVLGVNYLAHRIIWMMHFGETPNSVDHINGDFRDNRVENLRACTQAQNCANRTSRRGSSSQFLGVSRLGNKGKWIAQIKPAGKPGMYLGVFSSEEDAARAYNAAAMEVHGEFARLNEV